jgi:hypothetical protein
MTDTTPADEFRAAAFQLRNPFHLPGLKVVVDSDLVEPLADWLDAAAKSYDATVIGAASVWRRSDEVEERDAWVAKQTDRHALALARQINGTAP